MPLTESAEKRIARARRLLRKFPQGYTERIVRCHDCGIKATVRSVPGWHTAVAHDHHGSWRIAGFQETTRYGRIR